MQNQVEAMLDLWLGGTTCETEKEDPMNAQQ
jgi:hypothetical protein